MEGLPRLIATHPLELFGACAGAVLMLIVTAWWTLRRLRRPLWDLMRRAWHRGSGTWPPLARLRLPAPWQGGPLLLDLGIGFAVVLAAVGGFFELADEIGLDEGLGRFDNALAQELAHQATPATLRFFAAVTHLADAPVQWAIGAIVALVLMAYRRRLLAATWIAAVAGNGILNRALKALFERTRPLHEHGFATADGWSFPSGHASGAMVIYGMLAYLCMRATPGVWHLPIALAATVVILLVGYSRIVLQVHYLSDVLAAFVTAGAWLIVCIGAAHVIRVHREYRPAS